MTKPFAERSHKEMQEVLMDPTSAGPDIHYYMIRGGSEKKNITIWENGTVGAEYIKTYGHYHVDDFIETYTILDGFGILLLQARKTREDGTLIDDELEYVKAIFVNRGSVVPIPPRVGHLMANIGESWLVSSDDSPVNFGKVAEAAWPTHADYEPVKKMHGFAYYIVNENGKPAFVKNPNYKNVPDILVETA